MRAQRYKDKLNKNQRNLKDYRNYKITKKKQCKITKIMNTDWIMRNGTCHIISPYRFLPRTVLKKRSYFKMPLKRKMNVTIKIIHFWIRVRKLYKTRLKSIRFIH